MEPRQKVQALQYQNRVDFIPVQSIRKVRGCLQGIDTTIVLVEVTQRVLQQRDEDAALQIAAMLHQGRVVLLDAGLAVRAAQLGVAHQLPLADSTIYATAKQYQATVWTMNAHFAGLSGVRYVPKRP